MFSFSDRIAGKRTAWTPTRLFIHRLAEYGLYQWGLLRSAVDWTVAVYFILPAAGFGAYFYVSWWQGRPNWLADSLNALQAAGVALNPAYLAVMAALILYLSAGSAVVRTFVMPADRLFVMHHPRWYGTLRRLGLLYTVLTLAVRTAAATAVLLPLLIIGLEFSGVYVATIAVVAYGISLLVGLFADIWCIQRSGWRRHLSGAVIQLAGVAGLCAVVVYSVQTLPQSLITIAVLLALNLWCAHFRLRMKGVFDRESAAEREAKLKWASMLLQAAVEKRAGSQTRRTWLFRRSGTIFKKRASDNVLAEMAAKAFFRRKAQLLMYGQYAGVAAAAILVSPVWLKAIVWPALLCLLAVWMKQFMQQFWEESWIRTLPIAESLRFSAQPKAIGLMITPCALWLSFLAGGSAALGLGAPAWLAIVSAATAMGIGVAFASLVSRLFSV